MLFVKTNPGDPRVAGKKVVVGVLIGTAAFIAAMLISGVNPAGRSAGKKNNNEEEFEQALVARAKEIFKENKKAGKDMSSGPCLDEQINIDWVLDVAHNPREPIDDLAANQCNAFLIGKAKHFVELDEKGKFIRLK